jgi:hypothetical protein
MGKHKQERSEAHKQRIAVALKASWTPERRAELAAKRQGEANPFFGKTHDELWKAARSESQSGPNNPFYGKQHSEEFSRHQSEAQKGKCARLKHHGVSEEEYETRIKNGERWCSYKKHFAPAEKFLGVRSGKPQTMCEDCVPVANRHMLLRDRFGVDLDWYESKLAEQGGVCAICKVHTLSKRKRFMCIDHDHETGAVRGILCVKCNTSIERIETIENWALVAAGYLAQYKRKA